MDLLGYLTKQIITSNYTFSLLVLLIFLIIIANRIKFSLKVPCKK